MNLWNKGNIAMSQGQGNDPIANFFGTIMQSAVIAHIYHLKAQGVSSYAFHNAVGGYYDAIPGMLDGLVEAYQGCKQELVCCYSNSLQMEDDAISYFKNLKSFVINESTKLFPGAEYRNLVNEVDTITTLIDQTIYKLTFLK